MILESEVEISKIEIHFHMTAFASPFIPPSSFSRVSILHTEAEGNHITLQELGCSAFFGPAS